MSVDGMNIVVGPEITARRLPPDTVSATLTQAVQVIEGPIAQRLEQGTQNGCPAFRPKKPGMPLIVRTYVIRESSGLALDS